jgi:UDP-N-acetyl-D-galactosamine dehydrogenase
MIKNKKDVTNAKVGIFGFTFKENCPDTRNTKVIDIVNELREFNIEPLVFDPEADVEEAEQIYGLEFAKEEEMNELDLMIIAVNHDTFVNQTMNYWLDKINNKKVIMDLKGMLNKDEVESLNISYWRL